MRMIDFARSAAPLALALGLALPAVYAQQDSAQHQQLVQTAQARSVIAPRLLTAPNRSFGPYDQSDRYLNPHTGTFVPGAPGLNGD